MRHLPCEPTINEMSDEGSSLELCSSYAFFCAFMCMCVLDLVVYGWKGWSNKRQALCSLFFSLCLSYGCFPLKIPLFSVAISLSLSPCLTVSHPFLISPFGPPTAAAGKVLSLFPPHFLPLHSQRLFFWSHICFLIIHPSSQLTLVLVCSSLFAIVHHGTALSQTKPQVQVLDHRDRIWYFLLLTG